MMVAFVHRRGELVFVAARETAEELNQLWLQQTGRFSALTTFRVASQNPCSTFILRDSDLGTEYLNVVVLHRHEVSILVADFLPAWTGLLPEPPGPIPTGRRLRLR